MKTHFLKSFKKHYRKRIQPIHALDRRFEERYLLFLQNPSQPISGDIRVVYYVANETAYFVDIGTHNQVY